MRPPGQVAAFTFRPELILVAVVLIVLLGRLTAGRL